MRISDWSSDVCSSELPGPGLQCVANPGRAALVRAACARADQVAVLVSSRFSRGGSGASAWTWNQMFSAMLVTWSPTRSRFLAMNSRCVHGVIARASRSEEHTSELQSLMRISYAVFCLKKKKREQNISYET